MDEVLFLMNVGVDCHLFGQNFLIIVISTLTLSSSISPQGSATAGLTSQRGPPYGGMQAQIWLNGLIVLHLPQLLQ